MKLYMQVFCNKHTTLIYEITSTLVAFVIFFTIIPLNSIRRTILQFNTYSTFHETNELMNQKYLVVKHNMLVCCYSCLCDQTTQGAAGIDCITHLSTEKNHRPLLSDLLSSLLFKIIPDVPLFSDR